VDWNDLRYFLAVQRAGSFAGAARLLAVENSTVGRRIAALESALGITLFRRTPEGLLLTDEGTAVVPLAESMEQAALAIEQRHWGGDARLEGTVRLAVSEALSGFIVRRLPLLREVHPGIRVEILSGNQAHDLMRGEADLALRLMRPAQPELVARKLGGIGWSLYAAESYVQARGVPRLDDLSGHDVVGFDASFSKVPGAVWLAEHAASATTVLLGNSLVSILNALLVGLGIGVLPCFLCEDEPTLRRLTPEVVAVREAFLVANPQAARVGRVRAVMDFVAEVFQREEPLLRGRARPRP
jgi:DNA-binding transcriptional LysR family regulator